MSQKSIVKLRIVPTDSNFCSVIWLFKSASLLSKSNLRNDTFPFNFVWQPNLIFGGNESFWASRSSNSPRGWQFSSQSNISTRQVEHFPEPPHALKWAILFLKEAIKIDSSPVILISLLSGWTRAEKIFSSFGSFKLLWVPSQKGAFEVSLQPHKYAVSVWFAVNFLGLNWVPLWLPSQKGWFLLFPQLHQK